MELSNWERFQRWRKGYKNHCETKRFIGEHKSIAMNTCLKEMTRYLVKSDREEGGLT